MFLGRPKRLRMKCDRCGEDEIVGFIVDLQVETSADQHNKIMARRFPTVNWNSIPEDEWEKYFNQVDYAWEWSVCRRCQKTLYKFLVKEKYLKEEDL